MPAPGLGAGGEGKQIHGRRQLQACEAAYLEPANAEQQCGGPAFPQQRKSEALATFPAGEDKDDIGWLKGIRRGKPVVQPASKTEVLSRRNQVSLPLAIARTDRRLRQEFHLAATLLRNEVVNCLIAPRQYLPVLIAQNHLATTFPELPAQDRRAD